MLFMDEFKNYSIFTIKKSSVGSDLIFIELNVILMNQRICHKNATYFQCFH